MREIRENREIRERPEEIREIRETYQIEGQSVTDKVEGGKGRKVIGGDETVLHF